MKWLSWLPLVALAAVVALVLARAARRRKLEYRQEGERCCAYYGARQVTCWQGSCERGRDTDPRLPRF